MIEASLHERVSGTQEHKIFFSQINLPIILCNQNQLEISNRSTDALREDGDLIYRTEVIGVLCGTRHILWEEDVDACPHQVGWLADQSASRPTWLGIGLPVQFQT